VTCYASAPAGGVAVSNPGAPADLRVETTVIDDAGIVLMAVVAWQRTDEVTATYVGTAR